MIGGNYLTNPLAFLIQIVIGSYILIVMLRFLLQIVRADFYNPISQFTVKATSPLLKPLRRMIPGIGGIDVASIVLMWLLQTLELWLVMLLGSGAGNLLQAMGAAIPELVSLLINFFLYAILIQVILSWISPGGYNPAVGLIHSLTEPLLRPARRVIPSFGGLDLSPMVVMVVLVLLKILLLPPLYLLAGRAF